MIKDKVLYEAKCLKTNETIQFTLEDIYGYEGEVCGIVISGERPLGGHLMLSYNSGYGMRGMNPDIEISIVSINGKNWE